MGSIAVGMGMVVAKEDGLVGQVSSKGDSSDTETGERALESVPAREGTGVSPGLAVGIASERGLDHGGWYRRTIWPRGRCGAGQRRQRTFEGRSQ
jgi:hypothetical protein